MMQRRLRHWKQRFDPKAELIFTRPMQLDGETRVEAGDVITQELRDRFQLSDHRLARWWEARAIALRDLMEVPKPEKPEGGKPETSRVPKPGRKSKKAPKKSGE